MKCSRFCKKVTKNSIKNIISLGFLSFHGEYSLKTIVSNWSVMNLIQSCNKWCKLALCCQVFVNFQKLDKETWMNFWQFAKNSSRNARNLKNCSMISLLWLIIPKNHCKNIYAINNSFKPQKMEQSMWENVKDFELNLPSKIITKWKHSKWSQMAWNGSMFIQIARIWLPSKIIY